ncbi:type II toxin-antitoxin system RatA family toxin [Micromonospora mirobrigensis]|uniref:Ribosome association toxin PasT (RatA) of the RatAB toxin-antitoxin module n=1 Tax=Micromonospora mirobrigensis TaxID=262898 RepID=A0A1C4ZZB4_9ACTN|nr:SRPBCC family protein [Micromonospora mirobrigensis]SCF38300.1 Ribosome association toxin PasT (RatA) of the RatAB toxin-antitoxin module [Micromonospora mirobrigensis]
MRRVLLEAVIPATPADQVFTQVVRFDRYPDLAPHVQSTVVHRTLPEPTGRSDWELHFRSGLLRWTEEETFHPDQLRITFTQTAGDFDELHGEWVLRADGDDTALRFQADFDFGIPSLAGILDPIAERVIKETIAWVLVGLFDDVRLDTPLDLTTPPVPGGVR